MAKKTNPIQKLSKKLNRSSKRLRREARWLELEALQKAHDLNSRQKVSLVATAVLLATIAGAFLGNFARRSFTRGSAL